MTKEQSYAILGANTLRLGDDAQAVRAGCAAYLGSLMKSDPGANPKAVYDEMARMARVLPGYYRYQLPPYEEVAPK